MPLSRRISRFWLSLVLLSHILSPLALGLLVEGGEKEEGRDPVKIEEVVARGVDAPVFVQDEQGRVGGAGPDSKEQQKLEGAEEVAGDKEAVAEAGEIHEKVELEDIDDLDLPKNYRFFHGFVASISVIIVSEIGDKTFFIAAIMAMRHSRWLVFGGAISALAFMTVLSVCLGFATMIIPRALTFYISTALLALFGVKMLYEGYKMDPNEGQEELEEVTEELRKREELLTQGSGMDIEQGLTKVPLRRRMKCFGPLVSPIFLQAFSLTFLAEWGDRSQLTTIILGARENPLGVIIGGTLGHALCTALAVLGGKMVAQRISVKTVTLIGGVVFLLFAVTAIFHAPVSD